MFRLFRNVNFRSIPRLSFTSEIKLKTNPSRVLTVNVSTSWVNRRKLSYHDPPRHSRKYNEELVSDEDESGDEQRLSGWKSSPKEDEESYSSSSDNEEEYEERSEIGAREKEITYSINVNICHLPKRSSVARKMINEALKDVEENGDILVKERNKITEAIELGLRPRKLFFSVMNDIFFLRSPLTDVQVYKISPVDAPLDMQRKKTRPIFATFSVPRKSEELLTLSMPVTLICSMPFNQFRLRRIITLALSTGCHRLVFTKDEMYESPKVKKTISLISNLINVEMIDNFNDITTLIPEHSEVLVSRGYKNETPNEMGVVNFNELNAWSRDGEIYLIHVHDIRKEELEILKPLGAQEVAFPGAVNLFRLDLVGLSSIAVELQKQWHNKKFKKPKRSSKREAH